MTQIATFPIVHDLRRRCKRHKERLAASRPRSKGAFSPPPRANYQRLLVEAVEAHSAANPGFLDPLATSEVPSPDAAPAIEVASAAGISDEPRVPFVLTFNFRQGA